MITFAILLTILLTITFISAIIGMVFGAGIIVIFGDLFICAFIIWALVKLFRRKK